MNGRVFVGVLAAVIAGSGCATRQADLTVVSTRNVTLDGLNVARTGTEPRVTGKDVRHWVLFIPVNGRANIEDAVDQTLDKGRGDVIMDAVLYDYWWTIPVLYRQSGWKIDGTVINSAAASARAGR